MLKKHGQLFLSTLFISDSLAIFFSWLLAYGIRFQLQLIPVTLTAAGLAGFILSIGMAVDANVLVFERMKEELRKGSLLHDAVESGFSRAWTSIRDSNIATLVICTIFYLSRTNSGQLIPTVWGINTRNIAAIDQEMAGIDPHNL